MKKFLKRLMLILGVFLLVVNFAVLIQILLPRAEAVQCAGDDNGRIVWIYSPPPGTMVCVCDPDYRECCCGP